jgi:HK97 family phage portal protein
MPSVLSRMGRLFVQQGEQRAMDWWGADTTLGNAPVTTSSASHLTPVFAAIRHIVDFLSTLPVDAYRRNDDGTRTQIGLPPLLRSENQPGRAGLGQWLGQAVFGTVTQGNAVGWIAETDGFGFPSVVRWLRREDWAYDEMQKQWRVWGEPVPAANIVHIPWIVPTGCVLGLSPIEHFAATIRAGLSAQDYADVRRGGGLPPAVLKNNQRTLNPQQSTQVRDRAVAAFSTGKPFVTGSDWDLSLTTIPPNHAQFIETLKLSANQIASIYGIDPREVGGAPADSLTYSTDESRTLNRASDLRPYIVRLEDAVNRILPEKQYVKLNVDSTVRTDIKTRTDVIGAKLKDGRLNLDEARALDDLGPVPNGQFHNAPAPTAEPALRTGATP